MKTAVVKNPSVITINDTPALTPGAGDVLVQMHACGICGSDLEKVFGQYGSQSTRLGHETAGIILDVGTGVTEFQKGDRVFTHHHVPCYSCTLCRHGNETMCKEYSKSNLLPCGLSEQYIVPKWNVEHGGVLKLADSTTFEEAAMIEPLACCIRAWKKFRWQKGDSIAILGMGPTGMMHAMLAQARGFSRIFCLDVNSFRLDFAGELDLTEPIHSADVDRFEKISKATNGVGVDVAIVATSSLDALGDAFDMVCKGGTVVMFGVPVRGAKIDMDMCKVYSKEITLATSYAASDADTRAALNMIESGQIDAGRLVTHKYSIAETQKAFEHARSGDGAMKIIITKK